MKTGWLILAVATLLGIAAFSTRLAICKTESSGCAACDASSRDAPKSLAWMKSEFGLDEAEFGKVCALHEAYLPQCDAMCGRMAEASTKLTATLQGSSGMTPEGEAALRDYEALRAECLHATIRHLSDTAAVMKPEAGRAFMQKVLPHLLTSHQHVSGVTR